ncbi:MAG TPA: hypothetical protein VH682_14275 [Gemmataceae bacterium]|jgi:hypothetical protein
MKCWTLVGMSLLTLCMMLPEVCANSAPEPDFRLRGMRPRTLIEVKLVVEVDEKAKLPILQVPLNLAQELQPADGAAAAPLVKGADAGLRLRAPTVVAGLAMTLAFASGGLWLLRRGAGRYLAILVVLSLFAAGTAAVWTNLALANPLLPPALPVLKLPAGIELTDKLILEPVAAGDHLTLIVPKSMVSEKEKKEGGEKRR